MDLLEINLYVYAVVFATPYKRKKDFFGAIPKTWRRT